MQFINKCHRVWDSGGKKGQEGEATLFILCNKLFVGKIRWMIFVLEHRQFHFPRGFEWYEADFSKVTFLDARR